jgi:TldD protein
VTPLARLILAGLAASLAFAQQSPLLDILKDELDRNFRVLKDKGDPPPYFMAYAVTEEESQVLSCTMGASQGGNRTHNRYLDVTVRVGTPQLDNYRRIRGDFPRFTSGLPISIDDNADSIRRRVWLETDRVYRLAAERLIKIRTDEQVKVAEADSSGDFSAEAPSVHTERLPRLRFPADDLVARARRWSAQFLNHPTILASNVGVRANRTRHYLVSTEGTRLEHGRGFAAIVISARTKALDGMDLADQEDFQLEDPSHFPKEDVVHDAVEHIAKQLESLAAAPLVEPFVGPAILSGRAAGVFFHEIFGHRIEGHRQKDESEGQTFTKSVGKPVLPPFLSVVFDPTRHSLGATDLNGWYLYDDEGIPTRPVTVVQNGILKEFLMSRAPLRGFPHSNGHGRRQPGAEVVSRQSNLIVESTHQVSDARLREMLIAEIRRQNKPYGLYFERVTGGYTTTGRSGIQAFKVIPLVVYRVYPDGRPDELVRGVDIVGTPLASFAKIVATSDRPEIFNGMCGAESGNVPVSAVSPALLVSEIEVQKKVHSQDRPPLLPRPRGKS